MDLCSGSYDNLLGESGDKVSNVLDETEHMLGIIFRDIILKFQIKNGR